MIHKLDNSLYFEYQSKNNSGGTIQSTYTRAEQLHFLTKLVLPGIENGNYAASAQQASTAEIR